MKGVGVVLPGSVDTERAVREDRKVIVKKGHSRQDCCHFYCELSRVSHLTCSEGKEKTWLRSDRLSNLCT